MASLAGFGYAACLIQILHWSRNIQLRPRNTVFIGKLGARFVVFGVPGDCVYSWRVRGAETDGSVGRNNPID